MPMTPGRHGWWRRLLLAAIAVALVVSAASWAIVRVYGPRLTRERIGAALTDALGRPVRVGEVRLEPWLLRLVLSDLSTGDASARDTYAIRVGQASVSLAIESLWRRQVTVAALIAEPDVAVSVDAGPSA